MLGVKFYVCIGVGDRGAISWNKSGQILNYSGTEFDNMGINF